MKIRYNLDYFTKGIWSFVLIKQDKITFKSKLQGLKPLIHCIKKHKKDMRGAIVYDKIIGRAAAVLLVYAKAKEVWTPTISTSAKIYLMKNKVEMEHGKNIKCVMNRSGDGPCPMEKMSSEMPEYEFIAKMLA